VAQLPAPPEPLGSLRPIPQTLARTALREKRSILCGIRSTTPMDACMRFPAFSLDGQRPLWVKRDSRTASAFWPPSGRQLLPVLAKAVCRGPQPQPLRFSCLAVASRLGNDSSPGWHHQGRADERKLRQQRTSIATLSNLAYRIPCNRNHCPSSWRLYESLEMSSHRVRSIRPLFVSSSKLPPPRIVRCRRLSSFFLLFGVLTKRASYALRQTPSNA